MGAGNSQFRPTPVFNSDGTYRVYQPPATLNRKLAEFPYNFHYTNSPFVRRVVFCATFITMPVMFAVYFSLQTKQNKIMGKKRAAAAFESPHERPRVYNPPQVEPYQLGSGFDRLVPWKMADFRVDD
ncbi:uncharacterized protein LOC128207340 [Mya arenaria]|nr:uncharacterized protein LOC128207340 [Mya arenaria]